MSAKQTAAVLLLDKQSVWNQFTTRTHGLHMNGET